MGILIGDFGMGILNGDFECDFKWGFWLGILNGDSHWGF